MLTKNLDSTTCFFFLLYIHFILFGLVMVCALFLFLPSVKRKQAYINEIGVNYYWDGCYFLYIWLYDVLCSTCTRWYMLKMLHTMWFTDKTKKKETNHTQRFQSNIRRAKANDCKRIVHIYTCTLLRVYKYMVYTLAYIIRNMYALKW